MFVGAVGKRRRIKNEAVRKFREEFLGEDTSQNVLINTSNLLTLYEVGNPGAFNR